MKEWDGVLPFAEHEGCGELYRSVKSLKFLTILRSHSDIVGAGARELHTFTDVYACVSYWRFVYADDGDDAGIGTEKRKRFKQSLHQDVVSLCASAYLVRFDL